MKRPCDIAVIGAGVVGAAAAYRLARAGQQVVVLEAGEPGHGTSASSFAWVNAVRKEPEVYHRLNAAGVRAYATLAQELGTDIGYRDGGSLEWAEGDAEQRELEERVERLARRGYPAEWIDRDAALGVEPALAIGARVERVVYYAAEGWVDAPRLVRVLLDRAVAAGAEVRRATPARLERRPGGRVAVEIDAGTSGADTALVCAGPATAAVLRPLGVTLPVGRKVGLLAVTAPPPEPLRRVVHAPGIHLRPDVSGGLLLGADDVDALTTESTPPGRPPDYARTLLERARRVFPPARDVDLLSVRIGVRPMPSDGQTIAGRLPGFANAWVLATHSGVTLGPLLGRLIADEITTGVPSAELGPFRPDRFGR
jgi:glycine/D-amino acid oxidase-like deaminating enzyme